MPHPTSDVTLISCHTHPPSDVTLIRTIWLEDGIKGFYRGCATNLLRTTPAAALTFTSFELIVRALRSMTEAKGGADLLLDTDKEHDSVTQTGNR